MIVSSCSADNTVLPTSLCSKIAILYLIMSSLSVAMELEKKKKELAIEE